MPYVFLRQVPPDDGGLAFDIVLGSTDLMPLQKRTVSGSTEPATQAAGDLTSYASETQIGRVLTVRED